MKENVDLTPCKNPKCLAGILDSGLKCDDCKGTGMDVRESFLCYVGKSGPKTWVYFEVALNEHVFELNCTSINSYPVGLWSKQKPGYVFPCEFKNGGITVTRNKKASPMMGVYSLSDEALAFYRVRALTCKAYADAELASKTSVAEWNKHTRDLDATLGDMRNAYRQCSKKGKQALLLNLINRITS